jgi:hypothetical protein
MPMPSRAELLMAVDRLDDLVHNAQRVPLREQVIVDREELAALAEQLSPQEVGGLGPALDELQDVLAAAKPVPLTDRVRLDMADVYECCDTIRAAVAEERLSTLTEPARRLYEAVVALQAEIAIHGRIERDRLAALALQVSVPRSADLGPAAERTADLHERVRELQAVIAAAKPSRFGDRVRVDRSAVSSICEAIQTYVLGTNASTAST